MKESAKKSETKADSIKKILRGVLLQAKIERNQVKEQMALYYITTIEQNMPLWCNPLCSTCQRYIEDNLKILEVGDYFTWQDIEEYHKKRGT